MFLIPHRETKKIPSYQYHLNRYLKWLLFSALNRRSIQSQPNLGSPNPNQLTIFPELAFPYKTTGRSVFVHFCSFLGSPYCRIRIHTSDPQLTIVENAGRMSRPMLRAKTIGSKRCKQHNKTCVDPESNDLRQGYKTKNT